MKENQNNLIKTLQSQVKELMEWKKKKEKQQLDYPIDYKSMQALNNAFRETEFTRINVTDIFFKATTESPTNRGQMRFFDDLTNQNLRIMTSKNPPDAADFTGTFNLTSV